jgi:hypothetical protein
VITTAKVSVRSDGAQGQLVLLTEPCETTGASSSPRLAKAANCHGGRGPNTRLAAAAAAPNACNASPTTEAVGDSRALGTLTEPAQPPPYRARWPVQLSRDRAMPGAASLGLQRRADHRDPVRPALQHRRCQQHMRAAASRADRPPRTVSHPLVLLTD